jgi:hypothetical protein
MTKTKGQKAKLKELTYQRLQQLQESKTQQ